MGDPSRTVGPRGRRREPHLPRRARPAPGAQHVPRRAGVGSPGREQGPPTGSGSRAVASRLRPAGEPGERCDVGELRDPAVGEYARCPLNMRAACRLAAAPDHRRAGSSPRRSALAPSSAGAVSSRAFPGKGRAIRREVQHRQGTDEPPAPGGMDRARSGSVRGGRLHGTDGDCCASPHSASARHPIRWLFWRRTWRIDGSRTGVPRSSPG